MLNGDENSTFSQVVMGMKSAAPVMGLDQGWAQDNWSACLVSWWLFSCPWVLCSGVLVLRVALRGPAKSGKLAGSVLSLQMLLAHPVQRPGSVTKPPWPDLRRSKPWVVCLFTESSWEKETDPSDGACTSTGPEPGL